VVPAAADDVAALIAAHAAAEAEASAADTLDQSPSYGAAAKRCKECYDAIMNARPTDPIAMAEQIRFLVLGSRSLRGRMLGHIADQLEAMRPALM
jgi:3-oxoacyl-ACP reductase-like protein